MPTKDTKKTPTYERPLYRPPRGAWASLRISNEAREAAIEITQKERRTLSEVYAALIDLGLQSYNETGELYPET